MQNSKNRRRVFTRVCVCLSANRIAGKLPVASTPESGGQIPQIWSGGDASIVSAYYAYSCIRCYDIYFHGFSPKSEAYTMFYAFYALHCL